MKPCKNCGASIDKSTTACPNCGAPQRPASKRRPVVPLVISLAVICALLTGIALAIVLQSSSRTAVSVYSTASSNSAASFSLPPVASSVVQSAPSSFPEASVSTPLPLPVISQPQPPAYTGPQGGEGWAWVETPHLQFDDMFSLRAPWTEGDLFTGFLNVARDGQYGLLAFDGKVFLGLYDGSPIHVCVWDNHYHGGPDAYADGQKEQMLELGFPIIEGPGHGIIHDGTLTVFSDDGRRVLSALWEGYYYEENFDPESWPAILPFAVYNGNYDDLMGSHNDFWGWTYDESRLYGLIRVSDMQELLPQEHTAAIRSRDDCYLMQKDGKWAVFSMAKEQLITDFIYEDATSDAFFNEGYMPVCRDGKWGFINAEGTEVISPTFEDATHVFQGQAWVKWGGWWGLISIQA